MNAPCFTMLESVVREARMDGSALCYISKNKTKTPTLLIEVFVSFPVKNVIDDWCVKIKLVSQRI